MLNRHAWLEEWKLGTTAIASLSQGHLSTEAIFEWFHAHSNGEVLSDDRYVQQLYSNTYGRGASDAELAEQLQRLSQGEIDRDWLAVELAASTEAVQVIGTVIAVMEG